MISAGEETIHCVTVLKLSVIFKHIFVTTPCLQFKSKRLTDENLANIFFYPSWIFLKHWVMGFKGKFSKKILSWKTWSKNKFIMMSIIKFSACVKISSAKRHPQIIPSHVPKFSSWDVLYCSKFFIVFYHWSLGFWVSHENTTQEDYRYRIGENRVGFFFR